VSSRQDGSDASAAKLYERHGAALHRYALMILANRQDAEDAVQQVFATLLRKRTLRIEAPGAYLRMAVRNECFSMLRRRRDVADVADPLLEPAETADRPDERLALEAALRALPADQREVVHLKAFEGLTLQEIADLTSDSINTVASRYRYAMTKLKVALGGRDHD